MFTIRSHEFTQKYIHPIIW